MNNCLDLRNADAVCALLGLSEAPEIWRRSWPQSAGSYTPGGVFFLAPEYVAETCATLRICPELAEALAACAASVAAEGGLERLVWHLHWLISWSGIDPQVGSWPALEPEGHPAKALLYGLVVLAGLPRLLEINGRRGIDPEDTIETLSDLQTWATDHLNQRGVWRLVSLGWMQHHLRGHLFKLGRLEYI
ncbi:MAG: acyltransferase domain-containing protein, partial [Armatimonadota bacterium]